MKLGQIVKFRENDQTESEGIITRVWDKPAKDPYVTVRTTEDRGRTFVRSTSTVKAV